MHMYAYIYIHIYIHMYIYSTHEQGGEHIVGHVIKRLRPLRRSSSYSPWR